MDTHSPGVLKKKPGFPRIRHFKNHMPPDTQLKRRNFNRALAVDASIQQGVLLPGRGGCRGRSPSGGPHVSPGVDGVDLGTARTWAVGAWIWGAGHNPAFGPGDRRPLSRASPVSAALRRSRLLFLPLFSLLGSGVTPVPAEPTPGGWGRGEEGRGQEGRGQERRGLEYKQPIARRGSTSAPAGPWVALCGTRAQRGTPEGHGDTKAMTGAQSGLCVLPGETGPRPGPGFSGFLGPSEGTRFPRELNCSYSGFLVASPPKVPVDRGALPSKTFRALQRSRGPHAALCLLDEIPIYSPVSGCHRDRPDSCQVNSLALKLQKGHRSPF